VGSVVDGVGARKMADVLQWERQRNAAPSKSGDLYLLCLAIVRRRKGLVVCRCRGGEVEDGKPVLSDDC